QTASGDPLLIYCPFLFSSRRRHTRSKRDWSSDVCSSDLPSQRPQPQGYCGEVVGLGCVSAAAARSSLVAVVAVMVGVWLHLRWRSEERRGGRRGSGGVGVEWLKLGVRRRGGGATVESGGQ